MCIVQTLLMTKRIKESRERFMRFVGQMEGGARWRPKQEGSGEESQRDIWKWRRNQEGIFVNGGQARRLRQQGRDLW